MESITVPASMEQLEEVLENIEQYLIREGCKEDDKRVILISAEELFTNIASYAYPDPAEPGVIQADCYVQKLENGKKRVTLRFLDQGIPYNPLAKKDPDLTLSIDQRPVGGLGIYMVKQFMDQVEYQYDEGFNILVIQKDIDVSSGG